MKKITFVALLIYIHVAGYSQNLVHESYKWGAPTLHQIPDSLLSFPAIVVKRYCLVEINFSMGTTSGYYTEHKIIHVTSDAGIEKFNKVAIPLHGNKQLASLQVRAIDRDGKVTTFKKENLKELDNVDGFGDYKIFAIEGLTQGGELEYIYTLKENPRSYGRETFQGDIPILESSFELIFPSRFRFLTRSYNGLPFSKESPFDEKKTVISVSANNVPPITEEPYSATKRHLMRLDYKIFNNGTSNDLFTWETISQNLINAVYEYKADTKTEKFIKSLSLNGLSEREAAIKVEDYIKSNFTIKRGNNAAYENLKEILANHVANERGIVKLYMSIWRELDIYPQLVLTCNRYEGSFDKGFPTPLDIDGVMFYFPNIDSYLVPSTSYMRLGPAPTYVADNDALFISYYIEATGAKFARYQFKKIRPLDYEHNQMGVRALITFKNGMQAPLIEQENYSQGYRAAQTRAAYFFTPEEKKEDFFKEENFSEFSDYTILERNLEGHELSLSSDVDNFFKIKTTYTSSALVEQAGKDYLFSVGKIIGKQSELYQEKDRKTDVYFGSISNYMHRIEIEIPDGFRCTGLDALKISSRVTLPGNSEPVMQFVSDYQINDKTLVINIHEFYKVLSLPKEKYQDFRKVVNSAADFNKVVLVFEPI